MYQQVYLVSLVDTGFWRSTLTLPARPLQEKSEVLLRPPYTKSCVGRRRLDRTFSGNIRMFGIRLRDGQDASFLQSGFLESSGEHQAGLPAVFWLCQTLFEAEFSVWNIPK